MILKKFQNRAKIMRSQPIKTWFYTFYELIIEKKIVPKYSPEFQLSKYVLCSGGIFDGLFVLFSVLAAVSFYGVATPIADNEHIVKSELFKSHQTTIESLRSDRIIKSEQLRKDVKY